MPQLPESIVIEAIDGTARGRFVIDGHDFPWHIAADSVTIEISDDLSVVNVGVLIDTDKLTVTPQAAVGDPPLVQFETPERMMRVIRVLKEQKEETK